MKLEELFPGGEWVRKDEYLIRCPYCGDHKTHNHCYLNPEKGLFCCFYCGKRGVLSRLVTDCSDSSVQLEPRTGITEKPKYPETDFSEFPKVLERDTTMARLAYSYLQKRELTEFDMDAYDIRYCGTERRYYGRVLIPIYEADEIVCFIGRSFLHFIEPKYLFPHHGETKLTTAEAIFNWESFTSESLNVTISEGVFDAIALNRVVGVDRALSILSSELSDGQLRKLLRLPESTAFHIILDADAERQAFKVARKLDAYGRHVWITFLREGDPADMEPAELMFAIDHWTSKYSYGLEVKRNLE